VPEGDEAKPKENESRAAPVSDGQPVTQAPQTAINQDESEERTERTDEKPHESTRPMQIWLPIILNAILLLLVFAQAVIYYRQWTVMQEQSAEMKKSTDAATKGAKAAHDSVTLARENVHLDQRAWLAAFDIVGTPQVNKPYIVTVWMRNTGKTWATNVQTAIGAQIIDKAQQPNFNDIKEIKPPDISSGIVAPNMPFNMTYQASKEGTVVTEDDLALFNSRAVIIYIYGRIIYKDIFHCGHWTNFCFFYNGGTNYAACNQFNDAGDDKCP
jgi:hypothetical protein